MSVSDNINDIKYYNVVGSKVFGVRVVVGWFHIRYLVERVSETDKGVL